MHSSSPIRLTIYFVIALGVALGFAAAVVPHFTTGYTLHLGVLFAGLMPYLIYGVFINLIRSGPLLAIGVLMLGLDLAVKIPQRFLAYDGYASGTIYLHPLLTSVSLIVVLGILARRNHLWQGPRNQQTPSAKPSETKEAD